MSIFNPNDYKKTDTAILTVDEMDDRYINTEGDIMKNLSVKNLQLYDTSTIMFGDNTSQTTAFSSIYKDDIQEQLNNIKSVNLLTSSNIFTNINDFQQIKSNDIKIKDTLNPLNTSSLIMVDKITKILNPLNNSQISLSVVDNFLEKQYNFKNDGLYLGNKNIYELNELTFKDGTKMSTALNISGDIQTQINDINSTDISQNGKITTLENKTKKISYDVLSDSTTISNPLTINKTNDPYSPTPFFSIKSYSSNEANNRTLFIIAGVNGGSYNPLTKAGSTLFCNTNSYPLNIGTGFTFVSHNDYRSGLYISTNGGTSELHCGKLELNCSTDCKNNNLENVNNINKVNKIIFSDNTFLTSATTNNDVLQTQITTNKNDIITLNNTVNLNKSDLQNQINSNNTSITDLNNKIITNENLDSSKNTRINNLELKTTKIIYDNVLDTTTINSKLNMSNKNIEKCSKLGIWNNAFSIGSYLQMNDATNCNLDIVAQNSTFTIKTYDSSYGVKTTIFGSTLTDLHGSALTNMLYTTKLNTNTQNAYVYSEYKDDIYTVDINGSLGRYILKNRDVTKAIAKNYEINYNDVNFNGRTLSNCSSMMYRGRCTIKYNSSSYSMTYNDGFVGAGDGSGALVTKLGTGRISIILGIATACKPSLFVSVEGSYNGGYSSSDAGNTLMTCVPKKEYYYYLSALKGYEIVINITKSGTFTDLLTTGYIDVMITG